MNKNIVVKRDTEKPEIRILVKKGNEIVEMNIKSKVRSLGRSGYISVPRELLGKYVEVKYKK